MTLRNAKLCAQTIKKNYRCRSHLLYIFLYVSLSKCWKQPINFLKIFKFHSPRIIICTIDKLTFRGLEKSVFFRCCYVVQKTACLNRIYLF